MSLRDLDKANEKANISYIIPIQLMEMFLGALNSERGVEKPKGQILNKCLKQFAIYRH